MNERKCMSCGENPAPRGTGRFPSAVIEINNPPEISVLRKVVIPVSMGTEEDVPPAIGKYFNVLLQYEANGHIYLYSSDGIPTAIEANIPQEVLDRIEDLEIDVDLLETGLANETTAREAADSALSSSINSLSSSLSAETAAREQADTTLQNNITAEATARANADTNLQNQITQEAQARAAADTAINGAITAEASTRQTADAGLQSQIDAITASSDVKDIVGTKAELNNYDTSTLGNNDIIKVLQDESENNATTYYRWNATTQQFTLIGEEGPYYTKSQADTLLNAKQNTLTAGSNVQIVNDTISATDTTYTAGDGINITNDVISATNTGKARVLTTADYNIKSGTWRTSDPTTFDAVALWLMPSGFYSLTDNNLPVYIDRSNRIYNIPSGGKAILVLSAQTNNKIILVSSSSSRMYVCYTSEAGYGTEVSGNLDSRTVLTRYEIEDSLTSNDKDRTLSAKQGKVLKNFIGDLTNLTTTDKTNLVAAINEAAGGGGGPTVVQTTGTSTTDVMSQNAVTNMICNQSDYPGEVNAIRIGYNAANASYGGSIAIGMSANAGAAKQQVIALGPSTAATADFAMAIGASSRAQGDNSIAIGGASSSGRGAVAIGKNANATTQGQFDIGSTSTSYGYNSSTYRLLTGLYDPQSAHDAATKGYVDSSISTNAGEARELTSADYNWPTDNPDGIALWKLPKGLYYTEPGVKKYISTSKSERASETILIGIQNDTNVSVTIFGDGVSIGFMRRFSINSATGGEGASVYSYGLTNRDIIDSLTSTATDKALSANQGKVLNTRIGDLSTLQTTDKTSAVAAINELEARIAALEGN